MKYEITLSSRALAILHNLRYEWDGKQDIKKPAGPINHTKLEYVRTEQYLARRTVQRYLQEELYGLVGVCFTNYNLGHSPRIVPSEEARKKQQQSTKNSSNKESQ